MPNGEVPMVWQTRRRRSGTWEIVECLNSGFHFYCNRRNKPASLEEISRSDVSLAELDGPLRGWYQVIDEE